MNDLSPVFLNELFTKTMVPYDLRNDYVFNIPSCNSVTYGINSLCFQGTKLWGSLVSTAKKNESIVEFKRLVCQWKSPICNCRTCLLCRYR